MLPTGVADFTEEKRFGREWQALGFSLSGHPVRFYRQQAEEAGALPCAALQERDAGETVTLAGLCLRPHRPPTPSGQVIVFFTLEDESGIAQVTVTPDVYESVGAAVFGNAFLLVKGTATPTGIGKSLKATKVWALR